MKNLMQNIKDKARKGLMTILVPALIGIGASGCGETYEDQCETYQGFHRNGRENVYVFDSETRKGRTIKDTNQFNQTSVREMEAKYKILGDVAFEDSLEIGKKYHFTIEHQFPFADRI